MVHMIKAVFAVAVLQLIFSLALATAIGRLLAGAMTQLRTMLSYRSVFIDGKFYWGVRRRDTIERPLIKIFLAAEGSSKAMDRIFHYQPEEDRNRQNKNELADP